MACLVYRAFFCLFPEEGKLKGGPHNLLADEGLKLHETGQKMMNGWLIRANSTRRGSTA